MLPTSRVALPLRGLGSQPIKVHGSDKDTDEDEDDFESIQFTHAPNTETHPSWPARRLAKPPFSSSYGVPRGEHEEQGTPLVRSEWSHTTTHVALPTVSTDAALQSALPRDEPGEDTSMVGHTEHGQSVDRRVVGQDGTWDPLETHIRVPSSPQPPPPSQHAHTSAAFSSTSLPFKSGVRGIGNGLASSHKKKGLGAVKILGQLCHHNDNHEPVERTLLPAELQHGTGSAAQAEAEAERQRMAAQAQAEAEAERQRMAAQAEAEAERQRMAAQAEAEAQRQRMAAQAEAEAEAERQRMAAQAQAEAEAQRQRMAAQAEAEAEAERQRMAAQAQAEAEAERQRMAAQAQAEAEAERQRMAAQAQAEAEAERQRMAAQAQAEAEAERQRMAAQAQAEAEAERQRMAAQAQAEAEAERQRMAAQAQAEAEAERQRMAAQAQAEAEAERQRMAAQAQAEAEAERQRMAAQAQAEAEAERQRMAAQAEAEAQRQRMAAQAEAEAEAERQRMAAQAQAEAEAERQRMAAQAQAEAEAERQRMAAQAQAEAEAERQRMAAQAEAEAQRQRMAAQAEAEAEAERQRMAAQAQAEAEAQRQRMAAQAEAEAEAQRQRMAAQAQAEAEAQRQRMAAQAEAEAEAQRQRMAAQAEAEAEAERQRMAAQAEAEAEHQRTAAEAVARLQRSAVFAMEVISGLLRIGAAPAPAASTDGWDDERQSPSLSVKATLYAEKAHAAMQWFAVCRTPYMAQVAGDRHTALLQHLRHLVRLRLSDHDDANADEGTRVKELSRTTGEETAHALGDDHWARLLYWQDRIRRMWDVHDTTEEGLMPRAGPVHASEAVAEVETLLETSQYRLIALAAEPLTIASRPSWWTHVGEPLSNSIEVWADWLLAFVQAADFHVQHLLTQAVTPLERTAGLRDDGSVRASAGENVGGRAAEDVRRALAALVQGAGTIIREADDCIARALHSGPMAAANALGDVEWMRWCHATMCAAWWLLKAVSLANFTLDILED